MAAMHAWVHAATAAVHLDQVQAMSAYQHPRAAGVVCISGAFSAISPSTAGACDWVSRVTKHLQLQCLQQESTNAGSYYCTRVVCNTAA